MGYGHGQGPVRSVLGVAVALLLALVVFGGLALAQPGTSVADATTFSFSDCASVTANDLATAVSDGQSIAYTGATPCTVDLNATTLTAPTGVVVNITIEGGVGLTLDELNVLQSEIDISTVGANSSLSLDHVTLKNNRIGIFAAGAASPSITVTKSTVSSNGGGIDAVDAGSSSITVTDSTVSGIDVEHISSAVAPSPSVTVTGSTISGSSNDGIDADHAASPQVSVTDSSISGNTFYGIGAGYAPGARIGVANSTISGNGDDGINAGNPGTGWAGITVTSSTVSGNGQDGIDVQGAASPSITVTSSTLSGNKQNGIYAFDAISPSIGVTNSTISGNIQSGIYAGDANGSSISVTYSTISGNAAGIVAFAGVTAPVVSITATILADNSQGNCAVSIPAGPVTDGGYNLSTDASCGFTSSTSLPNGSNTTAPTDAQLALLPLGNYGGPTQTIALGPGSVAIDAIPSTDCGLLPAEDQRGIDRPQGLKCDVGAYEAPALSLTVDPAQPNGQHGWYTGDPTVTLGYSGLAIGQDVGGAPQAQVASCSGLSHTATTLNDHGTVSLTLREEGTTAIGNCGVKQGTTPLGFSTSGQTLFLTLKVDTVKPTINLTSPANGASYAPGATIYAGYTCSDATSQIATTDGCVGTVADGSPIDTTTFGPHTFTVNAADQAGNTATKSVTYTVSLPAPTLAINGAAPQPSSSGYWYNLANSPNGVTLTVSDSTATVTGYSCTTTIGTTTTTLTLALAGTPPVGTATLGDGVQTLSCTASDGTTTSAATTVTIQVDRTAPTITATLNPTNPASTGWYNLATGAPTVSFTCSDATSGLAERCPSAHTFPEGANQSYTASVTDNAGNKASATVSGIYVDLHAPTASPTLSSQQGSNGWYVGPVTVTWHWADTGDSGLAATCPATSTDDGPDSSSTSLSASCADIAGNTRQATSPTFKLDATPPTITLTTPQDGADYTLGQPVTASYTCADATSGVAPNGCVGTQPNGSSIDTSTIGSFSFTVTATDNAGNTTTETVHYTVGYGIVPLTNPTKPILGSYGSLKLEVVDGQGNNLSSPSLQVTALNIAPLGQPWNGQNGNLDQPFLYSPWLGNGGGYVLIVQTSTLPPGTYVLSFQVAGDPSIHTMQFVVG